jgi:signal transduction histidine kinase
MQTFHLRYRSLDKLKDYIFEHEIIDAPNLLIQIFSYSTDSEKLQMILHNLRTLFPLAHILGTTTDGEIFDGRILTKDISLTFSVFEHTTLKSHMLDLDHRSFENGEEIAKKIVDDDTKAVIVYVKSSEINALAFLKGLHSVKKDLVICGGLSADQGNFNNGYVFDGEHLGENHAVAVAFSSKKLIAHNYYTSKWEPIGREFVITKSKQNRLMSVDKMSVKTLYEKYLGQEIAFNLPLSGLQFPFVMKNGDSYIARTALSDPKDGSLIFGADMPEGEKIQIGFGDAQKMLVNVRKILERVNKKPTESIFIFEASGRRRFLKQYAHYEVEPFAKIAPVSGFYGYGEFFANEKELLFLNQSFTLLALSEKEKTEEKRVVFREPKDTNGDLQILRAISNIAKVSSMELQELNQKLEERVKEEVAKNRRKDSILIHNSRLAQMGEMMSLIAHQWRQPLSAISATSTGLHVKIELDKFDKDFFLSSLDKIEEYVKHLSNTVNDFSNFFKPSKRSETTTAGEMIERALFIMSSSLRKNNIDVMVDDSAPNQIKTYPNEIIQVLINLIKNAENALLKRQIEKPIIFINAYEKGNYLFIEVSDNAGGIDEKIIDRIFEPYFTTKNAADSTGLGLYMSKFIIEESCGGTLDVVNGKEGALFTIKLKY